jgi:hypothetical protein
MKLKDIINYLDKTDQVVVWVEYPEYPDEEPEKVFEGFILDIPWIYLDYYLLNDSNGEAISARNYGEGEGSGFIISLLEDEKEE